jgi:hypothetical protein
MSKKFNKKNMNGRGNRPVYGGGPPGRMPNGPDHRPPMNRERMHGNAGMPMHMDGAPLPPSMLNNMIQVRGEGFLHVLPHLFCILTYTIIQLQQQKQIEEAIRQDFAKTHSFIDSREFAPNARFGEDGHPGMQQDLMASSGQNPQV